MLSHGFGACERFSKHNATTNTCLFLGRLVILVPELALSHSLHGNNTFLELDLALVEQGTPELNLFAIIINEFGQLVLQSATWLW